MRAALLTATLLLAGCADPGGSLWTPDQGSAGLPQEMKQQTATAPIPGRSDTSKPPMAPTRVDPVADGTGKPAPGGRRRGSGTSPDILFPEDQSSTEVPGSAFRPTNPPPEPEVRSGSAVQPPNPYNPYQATGDGVQRQGTTLVTPQGNATITGSTIFGPNGKPCSAVGNSVMCN